MYVLGVYIGLCMGGSMMCMCVRDFSNDVG